MFSPDDAYAIAQQLQLPLEGFTAADLADGMNVELEHGTAGGARTDVTHDDAYLTAKIAAAHLYERPDYYALLRDLEDAPPRRNPGPTRMRIETHDRTQPGAGMPHVDVWLIEEPTGRPGRGKRREQAHGWYMHVGTTSPRVDFDWVTHRSEKPYLRIITPSQTDVRWGRARWSWHAGRWTHPEVGLPWEPPDVHFHAPWSDPTHLGGAFGLIDIHEYAMLEREYLRVLPLILDAFR